MCVPPAVLLAEDPDVLATLFDVANERAEARRGG